MIQKLNLVPPEIRSSSNAPAINPSPSAEWHWLSGGFDSAAAELVTPETSLQVSEIYAAVRCLSEILSSIPLNVIKLTDSGKVVQKTHPVHELLQTAVNDETTAISFIQTLITRLLVEGTSYSQIIWSVDGSRVLGLYSLPTHSVQVDRDAQGKLTYKVNTNQGQKTFPSSEILAVKLNSWNGLTGMSPVVQCKQTIGSLIALDKYTGRFFANNATPSLALVHNGKLKPEDKQKARQDWETLQGGTSNHRVAVLDSSMSIEPIATNPQDSQMVETRTFLREIISSVLRVPLWVLGSTEHLTSASLSELRVDFISGTLVPLAANLTAELALKLLWPLDKSLRVEADFTSLLKGDPASTATAVALGRQWSTLTVNESRLLEGRNPIAGIMGDSLLVPVNTSAVDSEGNVIVHPSANTTKEPAPQPTTEGNQNAD